MRDFLVHRVIRHVLGVRVLSLAVTGQVIGVGDVIRTQHTAHHSAATGVVFLGLRTVQLLHPAHRVGIDAGGFIFLALGKFHIGRNLGVAHTHQGLHHRQGLRHQGFFYFGGLGGTAVDFL